MQSQDDSNAAPVPDSIEDQNNQMRLPSWNDLELNVATQLQNVDVELELECEKFANDLQAKLTLGLE